MKGGMKAFATASPAGGPHHKTHDVPFARTWRMIVVSLFLGMTALVVSFGAASAFENSEGELIAPCVAAALYLVFCQFWVAPRGTCGFLAKLPTLVASVAPLLLLFNLPPRTWGIPWVMVSGCFGSVVGGMIAQRITSPPQGRTPAADSNNRGRRCRNYLLVGFILSVVIALVIPIGVIPSVATDIAHPSHAHTNGKFLGFTVILDLLAVAILASALWRPRERDPSSKGTLGTTAFLALLLGLVYCGMGVLFSGYGPALRIASALLFLCSAVAFITTGLMIVTSVITDRVRLSEALG